MRQIIVILILMLNLESLTFKRMILYD